jgi:hypothetical protein
LEGQGVGDLFFLKFNGLIKLINIQENHEWKKQSGYLQVLKQVIYK